MTEGSVCVWCIKITLCVVVVMVLKMMLFRAIYGCECLKGSMTGGGGGVLGREGRREEVRVDH